MGLSAAFLIDALLVGWISFGAWPSLVQFAFRGHCFYFQMLVWTMLLEQFQLGILFYYLLSFILVVMMLIVYAENSENFAALQR